MADAMFCDAAVENIRVMLAASVECGLVPEPARFGAAFFGSDA